MREAVAYLERKFGVSQRQACRAVGQHRSSQRYHPRQHSGEAALVAAIHALVREHPRFGYRRIHALLVASGHRVSRKRVHRLWRKEGFKVPRRPRQKRPVGNSAGGITALRAERRNHVWAWDFVHDVDEAGRPLKWLTAIDEYTRECVLLKVARRMKAVDVVDAVSAAMAVRGVPSVIRSDNGPEFIAAGLRRFLAAAGTATAYIAPGSPWENGASESFNGKLRDELLARMVFPDLRAAQATAAVWRRWYNEDRPHSAIGYLTPAAYAGSVDGCGKTAVAQGSCLGATPLAPLPEHGMMEARLS